MEKYIIIMTGAFLMGLVGFTIASLYRLAKEQIKINNQNARRWWRRRDEVERAKLRNEHKAIFKKYKEKTLREIYEKEIKEN